MQSSSVVRLVTLLLLWSELQTAQSAKILALINLASSSHYFFNRALSRALAARGHQVTETIPDVDRHPVQNVTTIRMEGMYEAFGKNFDYEYFSSLSVFKLITTMCEWICFNCEKQLQSEGAQKLLTFSSNEQFDLIIVEAGMGECFYGFITKFGSPPVVAISAFGIPPWTGPLLGTPENPSYIPNIFVPYSSHMSFGERFFNSLVNTFMVFSHYYHLMPKQEGIARQHFKENLPSFWDIERNFSLFLVNYDFGLDGPRPLSPNIIPVGGMHIKEHSDPLPKDLQDFLDEAKDGFIFFSMGTLVRGDTLKEDKRRALLGAFSELPQRILWKFESDNLPDQPHNVKIVKWLPQSDILAHPNIRMFISHCGRLSVMEATYRGVPIVGSPIYLDQKLNLQMILSKGVGVRLDYLTLTKDSVLTAMKEILNNNSYRDNMKKLSAVFRERSDTALERAVYWTEYVIRHNGAPHLRSAAADLYWHQYLLLDVLLFLILGAISVILAVYFLLRTICRTVTRKPTKNIKTN